MNQTNPMFNKQHPNIFFYRWDQYNVQAILNASVYSTANKSFILSENIFVRVHG